MERVIFRFAALLDSAQVRLHQITRSSRSIATSSAL